MLYHICMKLTEYIPTLEVMHYVSLRALMGLLTAFGMMILLGNKFIQFCLATFQNIARPYTPDSHQQKAATPTMGGILIIFVCLINMLLWCDLTKPDAWILGFCLLSFGLIGFADDISKVWYKRGISAQLKFRLQLVCALLVAVAWIWLKNPTPVIYAPIFKGLVIPLGLFFIAWVVFVLIAMSNAVNLTDGLDGLAIGTLLVNFVFFSGLAYVAGHLEFANYLHIPYTACSESVVVGSILVGASLGFYWFNAYPAEIFMGDVGSLSLGATLAMLALMAQQEMLLVIAGGLFVAETLSVIAQVFSFKYFGKRIFKMAPLHHHFELMGVKESKVTIRFHIITMILCLCAAVCVKLR